MKTIKILVVEDEAIIGMSLRLELESAGFEVCDCVSSGAAAIAAARQHQPDVVLMDIHLSGAMDGLEAARRIQDEHKTPVIFMTGYADGDLTKRAEKLNPMGYAVKPINIAQIKKIITDNFQP